MQANAIPARLVAYATLIQANVTPARTYPRPVSRGHRSRSTNSPPATAIAIEEQEQEKLYHTYLKHIWPTALLYMLNLLEKACDEIFVEVKFSITYLAIAGFLLLHSINLMSLIAAMAMPHVKHNKSRSPFPLTLISFTNRHHRRELPMATPCLQSL